MTQLPPHREISENKELTYVYSFCTLVTRLGEYHEMITSFRSKGFTETDCEFLYVDNSSENRLDAFSAYNRFLLEAKGRFIILCHQDILPIDDDREILDDRLRELDVLDSTWALAGNAGGRKARELVARISHPNGDEIDLNGPFPRDVMSLDENFIVVRRDANLALSRDLSGFHWYGSDLCLIADILGWKAYVIDFHLLHKSTGNIKGDFDAKGKALRRKYAHAFRSRWQHVPTSQPVYISASPIRTFIARATNKIRVRMRALFIPDEAKRASS